MASRSTNSKDCLTTLSKHHEPLPAIGVEKDHLMTFLKTHRMT
jgi:hypothetical protein